MLCIFVVLLGLSISHGKIIPYYESIQQQINSLLENDYGINGIIGGRNMITVPPNCPPGQQLVNGACRDIWSINPVTQRSNIKPQNVVTVPTNCPDGQELVNGVCRDIWRKFAVTQRSNINPSNVITVPTNCPDGQELINGVCRDVWRRFAVTQRSNINPKNVITVPTNCPDGQELINGVCRDVWRRFAVTQRSNINPQNVVTVPPNCPDGQELVNGVCRDIWRFAVTDAENQKDSRYIRQADGGEEINVNPDDLLLKMNVDRNIISIPNQCPAGYRPDIYGICRESLL